MDAGRAAPLDHITADLDQAQANELGVTAHEGRVVQCRVKLALVSAAHQFACAVDAAPCDDEVGELGGRRSCDGDLLLPPEKIAALHTAGVLHPGPPLCLSLPSSGKTVFFVDE
jgi:hypothetical protein